MRRGRILRYGDTFSLFEMCNVRAVIQNKVVPTQTLTTANRDIARRSKDLSEDTSSLVDLDVNVKVTIFIHTKERQNRLPTTEAA